MNQCIFIYYNWTLIWIQLIELKEHIHHYIKKEKDFFEVIIEELYNKYLYYSFEDYTMSINWKEFICLIGKCIFENGEHK